MKRKAIEDDLEKLKEQLRSRVGWLPGQLSLVRPFFGGPHIEFSLSAAIQAIVDHLGMEFCVKAETPKKVILIKKREKPWMPKEELPRILIKKSEK